MKMYIISLLSLLVVCNITSCKKEKQGGMEKATNQLHIELILPNVTPPGSEVEIRGSGFGTDQGNVDVKIGDSTAQVLGVADSVISIRVPDLEEGSKVEVIVTVGGKHSNTEQVWVREKEKLVLPPKDTITWTEDKNPNIAAIEPGITSYNGKVVKYIRNGQQVFEVDLDQPVVIAVADRPLGWGYFQFPGMYQSLSGQLAVSWSMKPDNASSYGKSGSGHAVSNDQGETWTVVPKGPVGGGTLLSNGDRITTSTPAAVPVSELELPDPVATLQDPSNYNNLFRIYECDKLPAQLQGTYQARIKEGQTKWVSERGTLVHPGLARYSIGDIFPVVWWGDMQVLPDGVYTGIYPGFEISTSGGVDPSGIFFYKSTDFGKTWVKQGTIPYHPDVALDPNGDKRKAFGWTEPAFIALTDGTFLCVVRTSDGFGKSPMYIAVSHDEGKTWSIPEVFTGAGVLPQLLLLDNGVIALSSGRPGVQLRFALSSDPEEWTEPFEMIPWLENEGVFENTSEVSSCGYTSLVKINANSFLIVYSDFKYKTPDRQIRKAIKVRKVTVRSM